MTLNWKQLVKSPQGLISLAEAAVVALGTAGIINTTMSTAIQGLLVAVLGVIAAAGHTAVSAKVAAKQAAAPTPPGEVRS